MGIIFHGEPSVNGMRLMLMISITIIEEMISVAVSSMLRISDGEMELEFLQLQIWMN